MTKAVPETMFASWVHALHLDKDQVRRAGEMIGLARRTSFQRYAGESQPAEAERLAMTASWLDLPPWKPEFADLTEREVVALHRLARKMRAILR